MVRNLIPWRKKTESLSPELPLLRAELWRVPPLHSPSCGCRPGEGQGDVQEECSGPDVA